jgi:hypothetical protein
MKNNFLKIILGSAAILLAWPLLAFAHEAYVLPYDTFWNGLRQPFSAHAFDALNNPGNLRVTAIIVIAVLAGLALNFWFRTTAWAQRAAGRLEGFARFGPHFVRFAIAAAFLFSALSGTFLGPELNGNLLPLPAASRIALFAIAAMIATGTLVELAAFAGIVIFAAGFFAFGPYMLTYFNYLGELVVLLLFGMRIMSVDRHLFGPLRRFQSFEKYETLIVRIFYGFALIYAAVTVKLLHPALTVSVVTAWHLNQYHWLFPSDPLLVTFGAGIVEMVIGLFIIFGFEMRLTILVSLFYITMSLLYFRELVWPHLLLYGISFNLLVQPQTFTLDHFLLKQRRSGPRWWQRPLLPHNDQGKSSPAAGK